MMLKHPRPKRIFMIISLIIADIIYNRRFRQPGYNETYDGDTVNLVYYTIGEPDRICARK